LLLSGCEKSLLEKLRTDPDPQVRADAARSLGEVGDERAVDALLAALHDPEETVRAAAAAALGKIGDPRAIPALTNLLEGKHWLQRAAEEYEKAIEYGANSADIFLALGRVYAELGEQEEAEENLDIAADMVTEDQVYLRYSLKAEYEKLGLTEKAQEQQAKIDEYNAEHGGSVLPGGTFTVE